MIITLTSDCQQESVYIAIIKGKILNLFPKANIVDISHKVRMYDVGEAEFIIQSAYSAFPKGTIHFVLVNSDAQKDYVLCVSDGHYFIGHYEGIDFTKKDVEEAYLIPNEKTTFVAIDVFINVLDILQNNPKTLNTIGLKITYEKYVFNPIVKENEIIGTVLYIDDYSNLISNITKEIFFKVSNGRKFNIFVNSRYYKINKLLHSYNDVKVGELLALINSFGYLEIAINKGKLASLLNINKDDCQIKIEFYDR